MKLFNRFDKRQATQQSTAVDYSGNVDDNDFHATSEESKVPVTASAQQPETIDGSMEDGVRKAEIITLAWSKKALIFTYLM
jgi:hypothetical protein